MDYFGLLKALSDGLTTNQWREELFIIIKGGRDNEIDLSGNDAFEYLKGLFFRTPDPAMARDQFGQALQEVLEKYPFDDTEVENERGYKAIRYLLRFILEYQNPTTASKVAGLLKHLVSRLIREDDLASGDQRKSFISLIVYCIDTLGRYFPDGVTYRQAEFSQKSNLFNPALTLLSNYMKICRQALTINDSDVISAALNYLLIFGSEFTERELDELLNNKKVITNTLSDFVWSDTPENYLTFVQAALKSNHELVTNFLAVKGCKVESKPDYDEDNNSVYWICLLPTNHRIRLEEDRELYIDALSERVNDNNRWKEDGRSDELTSLIMNTVPNRLNDE